MKLIGYLFLALIVACGSIPRDNTPPPIDNNLYTVEMAACGQRDTGVLGCNFSTKEDLGKKSLEIPLFHKGEYVVTSKLCNFNTNKRYSKAQTLEFTFQELLAGKPADKYVCDFDIKVFVDGLDKGFRGIFSLTDNTDLGSATASFWSGTKRATFVGVGGLQIRAGSNKDKHLQFVAPKAGTIVWAGCDKNGEKRYDLDPTISLEELFTDELGVTKSCILEVGLIPVSGQAEVFTFNIQVFSKDIVQLSDPSLEWDGEKLTVTAEPAVAFLSIDSYYKLKRGDKMKSISRSVSKDKEVWVRIATANGRYNLYKVLNGVNTWNSLILY